MIGILPRGERLVRRRGGNFISSAVLAACLLLPCIGCGTVPRAIGSLPIGIGRKSHDAELRAKVESDKFPTAKEAGL
jgi:hypothetical protein